MQKTWIKLLGMPQDSDKVSGKFIVRDSGKGMWRVVWMAEDEKDANNILAQWRREAMYADDPGTTGNEPENVNYENPV
jgi:hypothetical protein